MSNTIDLKILSEENFAKAASIIRKYENLSFTDIKTRIASQEAILSYKSTREEGLDVIIKCYSELLELGVKTEVFVNGQNVPKEYLKNLSASFQEDRLWMDSMSDIENDYEDGR